MVPSVHVEMEELKLLIDTGQLKQSGLFSYSAMNGVKPGVPYLPDVIQTQGECVMSAVRALCYLKSDNNMTWRIEEYGDGQISYAPKPGMNINILGWVNHQYNVRMMEVDILNWAKQTGEHPTLLIFAKGIGRIPDIGKKPAENGRLDISSAAPEGKNITYPSLPRKAFLFALDEVESLYTDLTTIEPASSLMEKIIERKERLDV
jgi:hypothetical protein